MSSIALPCLKCRASNVVPDDAGATPCAGCGFSLPPPAAASWWMARDGRQLGPYSIHYLLDLAGRGGFQPGDRVWHGGAAAWVGVNELPALGVPQETANPAPDAPTPAQAQWSQPSFVVPQAASPSGFAVHFRRALDWDLRNVPVMPLERERLIAQSVDEENARRYLCWRRSVLLVVAVPMLVSALLALISSFSNDWSSLSGLGVLLELLRLLALFALPIAAFAGSRAWERHRRSRTIVIIGWLIAFLTPLILALFPFAWRVDMPDSRGAEVQQIGTFLAVIGAVSVYITLMPAVLSLIPGVLRACLRIKALLPESILPGWFLIAATPLYVLLFLVIFTTINQVAGHILLMLGVFALLGAPLLYLFNAGTFTRPLRTPPEVRRIGVIQNIALAVTGIGLLLLLIWAFNATVFGWSLIGLSPRTSLMRPWDLQLFQFPLDYFVRSLFTTVVVADLIMLMNLSLWRQTQAFAASDEAGSYDRLMSEIEEAGGFGRRGDAA